MNSSCITIRKPESVARSEKTPKKFSNQKLKITKGGKGDSNKKKKKEVNCNFKDIRSFFEKKGSNLTLEDSKFKTLNIRQSQKFTESGCTNGDNKTYPSIAQHKYRPGEPYTQETDLISPQISGLSFKRWTKTDIQTEPLDSSNDEMTQIVVQTEPTDSKLDFHENTRRPPANRMSSKSPVVT